MSNAYLLNPSTQKILTQFLPAYPAPALLVAFGQATIAVGAATVAVALPTIAAGDLVYATAASGGSATVELASAAVTAGTGFALNTTGNVATANLVLNYQVLRANP